MRGNLIIQTCRAGCVPFQTRVSCVPTSFFFKLFPARIVCFYYRKPDLSMKQLIYQQKIDVFGSFKSFIEQKCQIFAAFLLFSILLNVIFGIFFGLLVGQNKVFEDVTID